MNPANPDLPPIPQDLDNALFEALLPCVGLDFAFPAVDVFWRALCRSGYAVVPVRSMVKGRSDA